MLSNINGPAPGAIASKLATIAHGGTINTTADRQEVTVDKRTLEQYVGTTTSRRARSCGFVCRRII